MRVGGSIDNTGSFFIGTAQRAVSRIECSGKVERSRSDRPDDIPVSYPKVLGRQWIEIKKRGKQAKNDERHERENILRGRR